MKEGKQIFEEVRVGRLRLRNRLVRSATWLGLAAPDGTLPEEAFATYRELAEGGVGAIEVSGNGTSVAGVRPGRGEAYFLPFAARLAREVPVPVILVVIPGTGHTYQGKARDAAREIAELVGRWASPTGAKRPMAFPCGGDVVGFST